MLQTYLKIAWRNAIKHRSFTLISMSSLVLGITLFFFISLWVKDEMAFDTHFPAAEQLYRVETNLILPDGQSDQLSSVGWPIGKALAQYPDIEHLTYLRDWRPVISLKEEHLYEDALYADEQFFDVFGYSLQEGNPATALKEPYSVVITPAIKAKYFGSGPALGKTLLISDTVPYKVTGVLTEQPHSSHLRFDMVGSFVSYCALYPEDCKEEFSRGWFDINVYNYVRLAPQATQAATESKIRNIVQTAGKEAVAASGFRSTLQLRPVKDIYLYSGMPTGVGTVGNIKTIRLFLYIGIFILLIACLNFINLSTTRSIERAKEIGIQKVLGNNRPRLIVQFLTEAALLCVLSALISIVCMVSLLPLFNDFSGKFFTVSSLLSAGNLLLLAGILALLIPLAGFYPALVLSSFRPIAVLKGSFAHSSSGALLRRSLVVLQFVISAGFIMCTLIMWKQMKHMQQQDLGFVQNNVLVADVSKVPWQLRHEKATVFKSALLRQTGMQRITACNATPGRSGWSGQFAYPEGRTKEQASVVEYIPMDEDYVKTMGLTLVAGRDILPNSEADTKEAFIVNETAVSVLGFGNPQQALGKRLSTSGKDGIVVGVVKDYHQHGLQNKINAVVLSPASYINLFAIRYDRLSDAQAIAALNKAAVDIFKGYPVTYRFLDEEFRRQYRKEEKLQQFFALASLLSIVIGCLGLLGLIIYTAQKRVKEIGVRKVLGAGVTHIVLMLSTDLLKLIVVAVVLAVPLTWWGMHQWLQGFAYRTTLHWSLFALAGLSALLIALATISVQAIKAALANPVKSLRSE